MFTHIITISQQCTLQYICIHNMLLSHIIYPLFHILLYILGTVKARAVYIDGVPVLLPGMDYIHFDPFSDNEPNLSNAGMFGGKVSVCVLYILYSI